MAQTTYITVAEWQHGTDDRVLADLMSDDGTAGTIGEGDLVLLNCIERASADVESYVLRGGRYTLTDLTDLQTDDDWTLKGLVADLATGYLYQIRGGQIPDSAKDRQDRGRETLQELAKGGRIFRDTSAISAGTAQVSIITTDQRARSNLVSDGPNFPPTRQVQTEV